jgi:hypothetical protein
MSLADRNKQIAAELIQLAEGWRLIAEKEATPSPKPRRASARTRAAHQGKSRRSSASQ